MTLRDYFGTDRAGFEATSSSSATTRRFTRFSQAVEEMIDARVYSGTHFRIADVDGALIASKVARHRERHYFHRDSAPGWGHGSDRED